jgi:hypothetical protein
MEIINPNEIGSKISTLILNAKEFFYAVTPFVGIDDWKKIRVNLSRAKDKGVDIKFFVREIRPHDLQILNDLCISVYLDKDLHTKLYLNQNEVIVTSMNLYEYSDVYSKDIALYYHAGEEYKKLLDYFRQYIDNDTFKGISVQSSGKNFQHAGKDLTNPLDKLHHDLGVLFPSDKITRTDSYLYFNGVVYGMDAFVSPEEICFKNISQNKKEQTEILSTYLKLKTTLNDLNIETHVEKGGYYKIHIQENNAEKTKRIIERVRTSFAWVNSVMKK